MGSVLRTPGRLPLVAPSILSADFARLEAECRGVLGAGADLLHLDVMDGHFVPNLTMGPHVCACLRRAFPEATLDVHLMVTYPEQFFVPFVEAGADHLTFHVEVAEGGRGGRAAELAERVHELGATAGLALNPSTPLKRVLPVAERFEMLLVMSVNPGFSGQAFIEETLEKTRALREHVGPERRIQMDGGIGPGNAGMVREAGCDVLVAASAIFGEEPGERAGVIRRIRGAGEG